jgi:choline-sulfatase
MKPNILLVMADQLIPFLTGAYGHPIVQTPNLNRLAEQGVRFDAAYSPSPVCAPARACMLTGKYASSIGAYDNAAPLHAEEPTIAHYLTNQGYDTVLAGKMHFVGPDQLHGFRQRFNSNIYPADFSWVPERGEGISRNHAFQYLGSSLEIGRWNQFLSYDEETHLRALEYLHAQRAAHRSAAEREEQAQPFFLCVSYHHPHEPFWPPTEYWEMYAEEEIEIPALDEMGLAENFIMDQWLNEFHGVSKVEGLYEPENLRRLRRAYYALVTYIDDKLGELLHSLDENQLTNNTIVIFCSDHGDMLCDRGMVQKRTFYEWSSRIPLIIRHPGGEWAGIKVAEPVSLVDLLPTILDLANATPDKSIDLDGRSLIALIEGEDILPREIFVEYHAQGVHAPCFMIRQGSHKYTLIHGHQDQLFNLDEDPHEKHNLSGDPQHQDIIRSLKTKILARFNPEEINLAVDQSIRKRKIVKSAMIRNSTQWRAVPGLDPSRGILDQYLPDQGRDEIPR